MRNQLLALLVGALALPVAIEATEGVQLRWNDVRLSIPDRRSKRSGARRDIVKDCHGKAEPGRLMAIMGPSGSGKTSLLLALAGQIQASKGLDLEGRVSVDGVRVHNGIKSKSGIRMAFLKQESLFYAQMTVRETLMFAARLRLPREMPLEAKRELVESLLKKLELLPSADTPVGDEKTRGISGGEKKRLSIACELLSDPNVLFCDEPTSGLDSFQAERVVETLQQLAKEGRTVVCVIHQPSGKVFSMFDDLVLLTPQGEPAYVGSVTRMISYFASLGYHCPRVVSPGEFAVNLVSIDRESPELEEKSMQRIAKIVNADRGRRDGKLSAKDDDAVVDAESEAVVEAQQASMAEQYKLLFLRSMREVSRAKLPFFIKTMQQLSTAIIYGGIYKLSDSQKSIQDRFGLLSLVAIGTTNIGVTSTVRSFPKEKAIFKEEQAKKIYGVFPYFLSKVVADIPVSTFLSCLFGAIIYPLTGLQRTFGKFMRFIGLNVLHSVTSSAIGKSSMSSGLTEQARQLTTSQFLRSSGQHRPGAGSSVPIGRCGCCCLPADPDPDDHLQWLQRVPGHDPAAPAMDSKCLHHSVGLRRPQHQ
eukprot:scaffold1187_cov258-Pinguiococcus_pyrenoidosus.AAC.24